MIQTERYAKVVAKGDREIYVERIFDASRDRVWDAYTIPSQISQWWGRGHKVDVERMEFERGGHWRYVERVPTPTGERVEGFEGRYREITPKDRIVRTFEWDGMPGYVMIESTTFVDLGDGRTNVINTMQCFTQEERDGMMGSGMERGMNDSYEVLDRFLAN